MAALGRRLAERSVQVDVEASLPGWEGGAVDYGWAVEWLREAAAGSA